MSRQTWRLKKISNTILGDLSYRTAGSMYKQSGVFEVVKADSVEQDSQPSRSDDKDSSILQKSSLKVNIPPELEGKAFIQVTRSP